MVATISAITPSAAWGQATTATILGTVADLSGATVIDAQVRNVATGILQSVATDSAVTVQAEASQGDELGCGRQRGGLGPDARSAVERAQLRAIAHGPRNQFGANLGGPAKRTGTPVCDIGG